MSGEQAFIYFNDGVGSIDNKEGLNDYYTSRKQLFQSAEVSERHLARGEEGGGGGRIVN